MQEVVNVFVWMCALGTAVAIPASVRKSPLALIGWLVFYLLAYFHLSANGRYVQDVRERESRWMPLHCEKASGQGLDQAPALNAMGAFFAPLVFVDRLAVHRPKPTALTRQNRN